MSRSTVACAFLALLGGGFASGASQSMTIPQAVERSRPGPYVTARVAELAAVSFESAVRDADLIALGTLAKPTVYLSPDQRTLYSDYSIALESVIASRTKFDPKKPVTVRVWGGETVINGVPVRIYDENYQPIPTDRSVLVFLRHNSAIAKYELLDRGYLFELDAGKLKALIKVPEVLDPILINADVDDLIAEIHRRGR